MHSDTGHIPLYAFSQDVRTRESLLDRVRNWSDEASWREFFSTYSRLVYSLALKAGLNDSEAEDVVQGTMVGVANTIRDFQYNRQAGSFKQWIGTQAKWRIGDQLRKAHREQAILERDAPGTECGTNTVHRLPDDRDNLAAFMDRDWKEAVAATALMRVKTRVKPKHFQIFDLATVKQWPLRRVSRTLGMNLAQVYLVKSRVALLLKQQTKQVELQLERLPSLRSSGPQSCPNKKKERL